MKVRRRDDRIEGEDEDIERKIGFLKERKKERKRGSGQMGKRRESGKKRKIPERKKETFDGKKERKKERKKEEEKRQEGKKEKKTR